ncbi:helix-turn-helix transcriptional regulator [Amycolatopsis sp.]|uniref:helix-turn-helix transcriptional regulator n=1 Tax=Amycolatopsis sp. TaxID=37632 RepID=UPI002C5E2DBF|nr:helix-turn-helix transcriptional regulator [Amycolatopsis sp.]HVV08412.1 helix-turn-helix transcriptional regulator [Amycolatopsis sp.]
MNDDSTPTRTVEHLIGRRLRQLQQVTGLPAVFGGAAAAAPDGRRELRISHLRGTLGKSLLDLRVGTGRGLGGSALATRALRTVRDYASTPAITHDFDGIVVQQERLSSIFALPVKAGGAVVGVLYGAVRGPHRIGDVVLERASAFGSTIERELAVLLAPATPPAPAAGLRHARAAVAELAQLAATTDDLALRGRLDHLIADLRDVVGAAPVAANTAPAPRLAPREVEVLEQVALGLRNAQVAEVLGLSIETVRAYLRSAMRKLGTGNRTAAVHAARTLGLL